MKRITPPAIAEAKAKKTPIAIQRRELALLSLSLSASNDMIFSYMSKKDADKCNRDLNLIQIKGSKMDFSKILTRERIIIPLEASSPAQAIDKLAEMLIQNGCPASLSKITELAMEREKLLSTALGRGVALPHCKIDGLQDMYIALGISSHGISWDSPDGQPVRIVMLILSPLCYSGPHVEAMSWICLNLRNPETLQGVINAENADQLLSCLDFSLRNSQEDPL